MGRDTFTWDHSLGTALRTGGRGGMPYIRLHVRHRLLHLPSHQSNTHERGGYVTVLLFNGFL